MGHAFSCDRCDELESGFPIAEGEIKSTKDEITQTWNYELCEGCAEEFETFMQHPGLF